MPSGGERELGTIRDAYLVEDPREVILDCPLAHCEARRDFPVVTAFADQRQHLALALCQTERLSPDGAARRLQERAHDVEEVPNQRLIHP